MLRSRRYAPRNDKPYVKPNIILVTGATGYVGGRLVPRLLDAGYCVCCLVRDPNRLQGRPWLKRVEVVTGDALSPAPDRP